VPIQDPGAWVYSVAGTFTLLNNIVNGVNLNQRVGSVVRYKRIQLQGSIIKSMVGDSYTWPPTKCRTLIVWDKDSGEGNLDINSLFADPTFPATSQLNLANREEHIIIMDKLWCSGYIHTVTNIVDTFWTLTTHDDQSWAIATWPNVAAFTTNIGLVVPGVSAPAALPAAVPTATGALVPTPSLNTFRVAEVIRMSAPPASPTEGVHNPIITYVAGGKSHKKIKKDCFVELYSIHTDGLTFPIRTGALWLVTVRDPYPTGLLPSTEFVLEGSVRLRFVDK